MSLPAHSGAGAPAGHDGLLPAPEEVTRAGEQAPATPAAAVVASAAAAAAPAPAPEVCPAARRRLSWRASE